MCPIKLKQWMADDDDLVMNGNMTHAGHSLYWRAVDDAVTFNIRKKEEFQVREAFRRLTTTKGFLQHKNAGKSPAQAAERNMKKFFQRRKNFDRFHWTKAGKKLPRPY